MIEVSTKTISEVFTMDSINHTTSFRTNKHLNQSERFFLEKCLIQGESITSIAKRLGRSRTTVYNEIKRGSVLQIKQGKEVKLYFSDTGQLQYEKSRQGSFNTLRAGAIEQFLKWVEDRVKKDKWSLDAAAGYALSNNLFRRTEMVCTKTLYNYLHQGILSLTVLDLPLIVRRSTRKAKIREHKRKLGKSIDLRDESIETREEFGHWEIDTVRGIKDKADEVLVTLLERKSRLYVPLRCPSSKAADVKITLNDWFGSLSQYFKRGKVCKTITSDNGSEFADIAELEDEDLLIYFAHPYSAWERGSNERHNGLLRRFIPKGTPISEVSNDTLKRVARWCNNLPRKILGYRTPLSVFLEEVGKLGDLQSVQFDIAI